MDWFARQFDAWQASGFGSFDLGRVGKFEKEVGPLAFRKHIDCPPYAQILLQGFYGAAIRHPEYHLATDLALLYNLFLDSQSMMEEAELKKQLHNSEHNQSLGRSVILTCFFNLLESFVSGLAVAFLMENPNAPADAVKKACRQESVAAEQADSIPDIDHRYAGRAEWRAIPA